MRSTGVSSPTPPGAADRPGRAVQETTPQACVTAQRPDSRRFGTSHSRTHRRPYARHRWQSMASPRAPAKPLKTPLTNKEGSIWSAVSRVGFQDAGVRQSAGVTTGSRGLSGGRPASERWPGGGTTTMTTASVVDHQRRHGAARHQAVAAGGSHGRRDRMDSGACCRAETEEFEQHATTPNLVETTRYLQSAPLVQPVRCRPRVGPASGPVRRIPRG
jgi:hypothetical protein